MGQRQLRRSAVPEVQREASGTRRQCKLVHMQDEVEVIYVVPVLVPVFRHADSPIIFISLRPLPWQNSVVKSIGMDGWSHSQIISMLEGGNDQLSGFFVRHSLCPKPAAASTGSGPGSGNSSGDEDSDVIMAKAAAAAAKAAAALSANQKPRAPSRSNSFCQLDEIIYIRYKTKAALFYRENLAKHVERVAADGRYRGREAARKRATGGGNKSGETSPTNLSAKASPSQPSPRAGMPPVSTSATATGNSAR